MWIAGKSSILCFVEHFFVLENVRVTRVDRFWMLLIINTNERISGCKVGNLGRETDGYADTCPKVIGV